MTHRMIPLRDLATARSGDKGNRLNIALVCRDPVFYPQVAQQVTAERVAELFASRRPKAVRRYDLPKLAAFNFVLDDVLEGGVNASLGLDGHGKSLSFLLLTLELRCTKELSELLKQKSDRGGNDEKNAAGSGHGRVDALSER
jgi:hypothetical protein